MPSSSPLAEAPGTPTSDFPDEDQVISNRNVDFARSKRAWFAYISMFLFARHCLKLLEGGIPSLKLGWTVLHVLHCLVRSV